MEPMVMMVELLVPPIGVVAVAVLVKLHKMHPIHQHQFLITTSKVVMDHPVSMHMDLTMHKLTLVAVVPVVMILVSMVVLAAVALVQEHLVMAHQELPD